METRTFPVERSAPLGVDDETYLRLYFEDLRTLAFERLDDEAKQEFDELFSPTSSHYLFTRLDVHATQPDVLALGRAPTRSGGDEL